MTTATLPYSPDAETALISRLLIEPHQMPSVKDRVLPDDFYDGDARAAYEAMLRLDEAGERIDIVTLKAEAGRTLDISLFDITAAHKAPVETYAEIVSRDAWRRGYIDDLSNLANKARRESDPQVLLSALQDRAATLSETIDRTDVAGRMNLAEHQGEPPPPLLDVLSPFGTTVLYGDGGDGKGWVAAKLAAQLGRKVAIIDFEMQPQEWAYRLGKFGVSLDDVAYFAPAMTLDRWATETAARQLKAEGVEFLLIDSAMYASNVEDPYSPAGALAYGRARRRLNNLPAILLAHTTGGADKVFGSVFWRNESRIVWRLVKDSMTRNRHLLCKKANGYSWLEGKRYEIEFSEPHGILNLHPHGQAWTPQQPIPGDY